jgi:hypothetical protein
MKKRAVLIVLLIAAAAGMAFAKDGRDIDFNTWGDENAGTVTINYVREALQGINISYSCNPANSYVEVEFSFTAHYQDGKTKSWTNQESWLGARNNSTWRFALTNASKVERVDISWKRKNVSAFKPLKL